MKRRRKSKKSGRGGRDLAGPEKWDPKTGRHYHLTRRTRSNPKISPTVWIIGGLALAGAGYLTYRYCKTHFTVAAGAAYAVPANAAITLTAPAGATWAGLVASDGSQINVALGQTGPLQFTAGAAGTSYTVSWAVPGGASAATITAQ